MKKLKNIFPLLVAFILLNSGLLYGTENLAPVYLLLLGNGLRWSAPTNLAATALSSTTIQLTWKDNSDGEDGFLVESEVDGTFYPIYQVVGANRTSADLWPGVGKSFLPSTTYRFRLKAFKGTGVTTFDDGGFFHELLIRRLPVRIWPSAPINYCT